MLYVLVSFLNKLFSSLSESGFIPTENKSPLNTGEWRKFSSLSESGFIPTGLYFSKEAASWVACSHLFQRVASFLRIWGKEVCYKIQRCSHLFQRVASFLQRFDRYNFGIDQKMFSSLSESGFIPTSEDTKAFLWCLDEFSSLSESGFIPTLHRLHINKCV